MPAEPRSPGPAGVADKALRWLVAEDHPISRMAARAALEKAGYRGIQLADNGALAVEKVSLGGVDAILMDCQMPVMDGFEATRTLRARGFAGPILAFTADASPAVAAQCRRAGMNACLVKPLIAGDILLALGSALPPSRPTVMTPQGPEDLPVFEYQQTLDRLDGDTDLLRLVAQTFCEQIPVVFQQIASAVTAADLAETRQHLHSLKGASAVCGARQAQALALSLQQAADAGALAQLQNRLPALEAALRDFERVFTASQDGLEM